jgi:hypothetical protein
MELAGVTDSSEPGYEVIEYSILMDVSFSARYT